MYKTYHFPSGREYYFEQRPKTKDLIKALKKDKCEWDFHVKDFEITKVKIIDNNPED